MIRVICKDCTLHIANSPTWQRSLSSNQHGFTSGRSTVAIFYLVEYITGKPEAFNTILELRIVFYCLGNNLVLAKLQTIHPKRNPKMVQNYLSDKY